MTAKSDSRMEAVDAINHHWFTDTLSEEELEETVEKLKEFNAKRKLKAAMLAVRAVSSLTKLVSSTVAYLGEKLGNFKK